MSYDDWKLGNPFEDEKENECLYCGEASDGDFCDRNCHKAYMND